MLSKGEDSTFYVMVDGAVESAIRDIEEVTINWGLGTVEHSFVGDARKRVTEVNNPVNITIRFKPNSPGLARIVELRRRRAGPLATAGSTRFDFTTSTNYGDEGRARWAFPNLKMGDTSQATPGQGQYQTGSMTFICDEEPKRI